MAELNVYFEINILVQKNLKRKLKNKKKKNCVYLGSVIALRTQRSLKCEFVRLKLIRIESVCVCVC